MHLHGVAVLYELQTIYGRLRLIGELHGPSSHSCNIMDYLDKHKGDIWTELEGIDAMLAATDAFRRNHIDKPLVACALHQFLTNDKRVQYCNIRRRAPFYIIESILHNNSFHTLFTRATPNDTQKRTVKAFEKAVSEHMRSRSSTMRFLYALVRGNIPQWYQTHLQQFEKANMRSMPCDYESIIQACPLLTDLTVFVKNYWKSMVEDNDVFSRAMLAFESTRETKTSKDLVVDKYHETLREYFVKLFSILMDVYMIAKYIHDAPTELSIVLGASHLSRILQFLVQHNIVNVKESKLFAAVKGKSVDLNAEYIDMSQPLQFAIISHSVTNTLTTFLDQRNLQA